MVVSHFAREVLLECDALPIAFKDEYAKAIKGKRHFKDETY